MTNRSLLIAALVGILVLAGGGYAYYLVGLNAPAFRGQAIPIGNLKEEVVDEWESAFEQVLKDEEVLQIIVDQSDYAAKLGIEKGEAVNHLKEAVRVRFKNSTGQIQVGLVGKRKDDAKLLEIAPILYQEAQKAVLEVAPSFQAYLDAVEAQKSQ